MDNVTRSPKELLHFVVAAGGNLPLAAERAGVTKQELAAMIAGEDTVTLSQGLRSLLLLNLFDNIQQTSIAFRGALPYMSPGDISKAYAAQLTAFAALSAEGSPDLSTEVHDAANAKQSLVTKLESWQKRHVKHVEASVEDVS